MSWEILNWWQDVWEHPRVSSRRKALRRPGQGFDYTQDKETVRQIVSRLHPQRMQLQVLEIIQETPSTKIFRFERCDGELPPFRPGQYVSLLVDVDGVLTNRPYSISSPPGSKTLDLTVRDRPGGFVAPYLLHELRVGDHLESSGPTGSFYHEPLIDGEELVFLAGGSGITPFASMIRDALQSHRPLKIQMLYGSRRPEDVIFGNELAQLAQEHPDFDYSLVISEPPPGYQGPTGFLDAQLIKDQIGKLEGKTFYLCGPNQMLDFCLAALQELGVPSFRIRRELYGPPSDVTREPGWPEGLAPDELFTVQVVGHQSVRAPAGEPLLNTLERYGWLIPALCRSGECSACRVRLLSGRVFMPAYTGLRESDREHGYIHACVSYPLEDLQIRL